MPARTMDLCRQMFYIMGFTVNLYTHSKRDNSTKRPSGSGTSYSCILKHGCGIQHPAITLNLGLTADPSIYNYAYIPVFERYYFIEEWYFEDALWTAQLKVDVLATFKSEIGSSTLYVLRSANEYDGRIIDTFYPTYSNCSFSTVEKTNPWNSGIYIVGIAGPNGQFGSMNFYAMTASQVATMCSRLTDATNIINNIEYNNFEQYSQALQLSLVDPLQYIKSCTFIPVGVGDISNVTLNPYLVAFRWYTGTQGYQISPNSRITKSFTFAIPKHPDSNARGSYVNTSPFTNLFLTVPPFGTISIDTTVTCNATNLYVDIEVDPITGKAILTVSANDTILNRIESQVGVEISLTQITRDYVGAITNTAQAVTNAVGGFASGNIAGGIGSSIGNIGNAVQAIQARANTVGTTGSFVGNHGSFRLDAQFFRPVTDDPTHNGRPLCQNRQLSNLGGYMLIQDGDVPINGTLEEATEIKSFLESGFYYE